MILNRLAGRSYHDLSKYPVFPWILSNYASEEIDLNDPSNYRDLSKPVGALNEKRLREFIERMEMNQGSEPVIPPFLYGAHYASIGTVLFYLIRIYPYTTYSLILQSGRFDKSDRLFYSVSDTWANCLNSPTDMKELVPEFYYDSQFLYNLNKLNLGTRQDGNPISFL